MRTSSHSIRFCYCVFIYCMHYHLPQQWTHFSSGIDAAHLISNLPTGATDDVFFYFRREMKQAWDILKLRAWDSHKEKSCLHNSSLNSSFGYYRQIDSVALRVGRKRGGHCTVETCDIQSGYVYDLHVRDVSFNAIGIFRSISLWHNKIITF